MKIAFDFYDHEAEQERRHFKNVCFAALMATLMFFVFLVCWGIANASEYTDTAIVDAIFVIEGGYRAQYLYGIRSVKYSDEAEARRICYNTVRNNRKRFAKQTKYTDYLEFLASRYCPTAGNLSKAEQRLNRYWLGNLRKQLARNNEN